jgi:uncharacterized protein (DUF486 family)
MLRTVGLLIVSNLFMTYAWYGHLKTLKAKAVWIAILASWGVAFFEYCFQVPANRIGSDHFTLPQLKVLQEVITMVVFSGFAVWYMGVPVTRNFLWASLCLVGAAYFIFKDGVPG